MQFENLSNETDSLSELAHGIPVHYFIEILSAHS